MTESTDEESTGEKPVSGESRRDFLKIAVTASALLAVAGIAGITKSITNPAPASGASETVSAFPKIKVGTLNQLQVNQPISFYYPLDNEPNILVKLGQRAQGGVGPEGDIVAFSQLCQHLGCPYAFEPPEVSPTCNASYKAAGPVGYCCCHGSSYDFLNSGKVLGGPAPRPVPQVILEVDTDGNIYATGMSPPTIFGHDTGSTDVSADLQGGNLVIS